MPNIVMGRGQQAVDLQGVSVGARVSRRPPQRPPQATTSRSSAAATAAWSTPRPPFGGSARRRLRRASRGRGCTRSDTPARRSFKRGLNAKQVQVWLGHHSPAFTLAAYVHLLSDDLPQADFLDEVASAGVARKWQREGPRRREIRDRQLSPERRAEQGSLSVRLGASRALGELRIHVRRFDSCRGHSTPSGTGAVGRSVATGECSRSRQAPRRRCGRRRRVPERTRHPTGKTGRRAARGRRSPRTR